MVRSLENQELAYIQLAHVGRKDFLASRMSRSLYDLAIKTVVRYHRTHFFVLGRDVCPLWSGCLLTNEMKFDVLWGLFTFNLANVRPGFLKSDDLKTEEEMEMLASLAAVLSDLKTFSMLLDCGQQRVHLYQMCHAIVNCLSLDNRLRPFDAISFQVREALTTLTSRSKEYEIGPLKLDFLKRQMLQNAHKIVGFFSDSGWYEHAITILRSVESAVLNLQGSFFQLPDVVFLNATMNECQLRLLRVLSDNCDFTKADLIYQRYTGRQEGDAGGNLSALYSEMSRYCFTKSLYDLSFNWSMKAVGCLNDNLSPKIIIDVLRMASKACVVKRHFPKAELLIHEAVLLAKETYGDFHPKYADCLSDFGFFLLNVDGSASSFTFYHSATKIRENIFGDVNLLTAIGREDAAYATYVYEYNSGKFDDATAFAELALETMQKMLQPDHLLMASAKRVLALILEEIAVDMADKVAARSDLERAEELHLSALRLAIQAFGENNIQTAKHYGNLGRLYQSMELPEEAERMHLKAIAIKELLLGPADYEVALSIGHLASLYNYDKMEYEKAEVLYLRSISIGIKLFGQSYSGLEYDYRGLVRVYQARGDMDKVYEYRMKLNDWKHIRAKMDTQERPAHMLEDLRISRPLNSIVKAVILPDNQLIWTNRKGEK